MASTPILLKIFSKNELININGTINIPYQFRNTRKVITEFRGMWVAIFLNKTKKSLFFESVKMVDFYENVTFWNLICNNHVLVKPFVIFLLFFEHQCLIKK